MNIENTVNKHDFINYPIIVDILFENDLKDYIYSLIQYPQKLFLLCDIVSFHHTYHTLLKLYEDVYINKLECEKPEDIEWLINDIMLFINEDNPSLIHLTQQIYNIFTRLPYPQLKNETFLKKYINVTFHQKPIIKQIRTVIALLTPDERQILIHYLQSRFQII
jgi:hypothetical protein